MLRNASLLVIVTGAAFAILGLWVWVWSPTLAKGLALSFSCSLLFYFYLVRLVIPLVRTRRWQFSTLDLFGLVVAFAFLSAIGRSLDGILALALWPWTVFVFRWRSIDPGGESGLRGALFWAHWTYLGFAMISSALVEYWLTSQWPIRYDCPLVPPLFTFLLLPAVATMMALQQNLAVDFVHPSLIAGIVVSIGTAALVAACTSWLLSVLVLKLRPLC